MLQSCRIEVPLGGLVSCYKKTKEEAPEVISSDSFNCGIDPQESQGVLLANGMDLNSCIQKHEKSLVYIWAPNCRGDLCYALDLFQSELDKKGIELFVVAEYYDSEKMSKSYKLSNPILGIDIKHYRSIFTAKYLRRFLHDVSKGEVNRLDGRLLYFEKGEFVDIYSDLMALVN